MVVIILLVVIIIIYFGYLEFRKQNRISVKNNDTNEKRCPLKINGTNSLKTAFDYYNKKDNISAISILDNLILNYTVKRNNIYDLRGMCNNSLGYYLDSIDDYTESIRLNGNDPNIYFLRGMSYQSIGYINEAVKDISIANRMKPDFDLYTSSLRFNQVMLENSELIEHMKEKAKKDAKLMRRAQGMYYEELNFSMKKAEHRYGKALNEYNFIGIVFEGSVPMISFNQMNVTIKLTPTTHFDYKQGIFQLTHESIHLLSPFGELTTNAIEEGLAVHFSLEMTENITKDLDYVNRAKESLKESVYYKPYLLVSELLSIDINSIKKLRKINPVIGKLTFEDFKKAELQIPDEMINKLLDTVEYQTNH